MLLAQFGKVAIAQLTCSILDGEAIAGSEGLGVERGGKELDVVTLRQTTDKELVTVAVAGTEVEITMRNSKGYAGAVDEVGHCNRITSTADGKQEFLF